MSTPTNIPETPMGETEQDSSFESKEKFQQQLQDIFQTILRLTGPDHFDQLCHWMEYKQYLTIDEFYESSYNDPEKFDTKGSATEYRWKGKMNQLSPNIAQKLKCFVRWMTHEDRPYELYDDFLATLTRERYLKFRYMDTLSFSASSPSHHEPSKLKTSFSGESKHQTPSESQTALNNFKKGTKRDDSVYPIFKNDKYYDTFQRSFLANLKAQGLYDVADPDHDPENGDIYEKELFKGKQSFVYSVLVTSLQTEKGRELVKEFEGDARSIILKLHHYHTKSNVAQHDIITLTTDITNLTLNDSWKGTVRQFLSHFKEKLRLLDSLVPVSDQLPETTRITFLQRAVQQNHDLRQIHVMDSVWRLKTDSTDALTFDTYYNLLWDAAHQYDLHQVKKGPQRKAFFSQQEEISDDDEYANAEEQFPNDPEPEEHLPYSVYQSSFHPKMPQKSFLPPHIWETPSESTKQMIIEHNKKVKLNNPTPYPSGSKTKPNPTLDKSTPAPQQVHQHSQDEPTEEPPPDTSTQTLVNQCLAASGIDPTDIQNVMSVSHAKRNISSHESSRQIQTHQRYVFARVNQTNHQIINRGANGGLAGADMRVIHTTPRKINIVGIDDHELTGLNVVTAATLLDTQKGPIIGVFHKYAHLGKGRSIHAAGQMEWFNCQVDDRSKLVGSAQSIQTSEGYVISLSIESGLVYMHSMRIPTDHDLQNYPHVFFTSPDIWDTSVLDHGISQSLLEDINQHSDDSLLQDSNFDAYGEPYHRATQTLNSSFCDLPSLPPGEPITHVHLHETKTSPNLRLDPPIGEDQPHDLTSDVFVYDRPNPPNPDEFDNTTPMSIINFDDLLGRTFLLPVDENGERKGATISEHVNDLYQAQVSREGQLRFKLKTDGDQLDDLISHNQLMEYLEDRTDTGPLEDGFYRFKSIKDHKGPYTSSDPAYNGSSYNLLIERETGEQTWETKDNNKWKEATVHDKKHITKGHQKIRVHFVFDVKHYEKFKARLLADGHFTKEPMETVYSGMFLAEPTNLELWGADAGHAYNLQALTREKLYTMSGPECWHNKFYEILHQMSFKPSRADPDTWIKYPKDGSHYEYIAVYVDDLVIYMEDPKSFCDKLREVAPLNYHLGCGYTSDEDNPTNTLSKHWVFANIWPLLKPLLFWKGDTDELNAKTKGSDRIPTKKSLV